MRTYLAYGIVILSALFIVFLVGLAIYFVARITIDAIYEVIRSGVAPINPRYKSVIKKYLDYYKRLPPPNKNAFERKVQYFITAKLFFLEIFPKSQM